MKKCLIVAAMVAVVMSGLSAGNLAVPEENSGAVQGEEWEPIRLEGTMIGFGGRASGTSVGLTIRIEGQTSDEELAEFIELTKEGGSGQRSPLRRRLERVSGIGRISSTGSTGTNLAVVRRVRLEDGSQMISLMTARQMPIAELRHGGRTTDYPFSFIQLLLDEEGRGQGTVIVAARILFSDEGQLEIESHGLQPFQIRNVRAR